MDPTITFNIQGNRREVKLFQLKSLMAVVVRGGEDAMTRDMLTIQANTILDVFTRQKILEPPSCQVLKQDEPCPVGFDAKEDISLDFPAVDLKGKYKCLEEINASKVHLAKSLHCPLTPYEYMLSNVTFSSDNCIEAKSCSGDMLLTKNNGTIGANLATGWCRLY